MISIIGSGKVGSAVAFLAASNSLDDILLINRTKKKAVGESLDISNAIPDESKISITGSDDYSKIKDSEIVIITASTETYTSSRMEILKDQIPMVQKIAEKIKKYAPDSKILMVSNPLDILTYTVLKSGNFNPNKVIGIASSLDSSRFQFLLAQELEVKHKKIINHMVLGEHGDSMVPIFSNVKLDDKPVLDYLNEIQIKRITKDLRNYWRTLREFKSRSVFGISKKVYDVINTIYSKSEISIPASVLLNGEYGLSDVCLGVPVSINKNGVDKINEIKISEKELVLLEKSAATIRKHLPSF